jgi:catechol 2,3-dioxygenase-like lactoylglutathione lyase family enzyme
MPLPSRDDVRVCRDCVEWLAGKLGVVSTPTLPVTDLPEATAFYERAGFGVRVYKEDDDDPGDGFAFVSYDDQSVFDLDVVDIDPDANRAGCYLIVQDADAWHARMLADGLPVTPIEDQPWGMREFTLTDPSGNHVRIGRGEG